MQEELMEQVVEKEKIEELLFLVIHNDDVNSFENVIDLLIKVCGLDVEQATQCTMTSHYSGKCDVKAGSKKELTILKDKLIKGGLGATIE